MTLAALTHALPSLQAAKCSAVGLCAAVVALAAGPALAESRAYVPNEKAGTVSVIDTAADQVIGEIEVGVRPRGVAASPDGKFLYVSDQRRNVLHVIDLAARSIVVEVEIGVGPGGRLTASPEHMLFALEENGSTKACH